MLRATDFCHHSLTLQVGISEQICNEELSQTQNSGCLSSSSETSALKSGSIYRQDYLDSALQDVHVSVPC